MSASYDVRAKEKREFAERARQLASHARDPSIRRRYLELAADNDRRAERLEEIHRHGSLAGRLVRPRPSGATAPPGSAPAD